MKPCPDEPDSPRRRQPAAPAVLAAVVGIVALASLLRLMRIGWDLPERLPFPDEPNLWEAGLRGFVPLRFSSYLPSPLVYPSFHLLLTGTAVACAHALGFVPDPANDLLPAILVGRIVAALAGVACCLVVAALARSADSRRAGLFAGALMAVMPLDVLQSHYLSIDNLLTVCIAATVLASIPLGRRGTVPTAFAAGFVAGLAFSAKYSGVAILAVPLWAAVDWFRRREDRLPVVVLLLLLAAIGIGWLVGVSAGCPQCVRRPSLVIADLRIHAWVSSHVRQGNNWRAPSLGWAALPVVNPLVVALPWAMGWPAYLAALAGLAAALRRRDLADRLLVVGIAALLLSSSWSIVVFPRYFLPIVPLLVVLAARWLATGSRASMPSPAAAGPGRGRLVLLAGIWSYSLLLTLSQVGRFSLEQQRAAADFVAARFARITAASPGVVPRVSFATPVWFGSYFRLQPFLASHHLSSTESPDPWTKDRPEAIILPDWYAISIRRDSPRAPVARELARLESGRAGYHRAAVFRSRYFTQGLYTVLDPALAADLWQGEIGFAVWLRDDLADRRLGGHAREGKK